MTQTAHEAIMERLGGARHMIFVHPDDAHAELRALVARHPDFVLEESEVVPRGRGYVFDVSAILRLSDDVARWHRRATA